MREDILPGWWNKDYCLYTNAVLHEQSGPWPRLVEVSTIQQYKYHCRTDGAKYSIHASLSIFIAWDTKTRGVFSLSEMSGQTIIILDFWVEAFSWQELTDDMLKEHDNFNYEKFVQKWTVSHLRRWCFATDITKILQQLFRSLKHVYHCGYWKRRSLVYPLERHR